MENVSDVLVSIGLPVFNGEQYLSEAIDSLLAQSHARFELIISDNASSDRTREIVEDYAARDGRIRYFRQAQNIGPAGNYLFTLSEARGAYFMWAAHDDIWDSRWISVLLSEFTDGDVGVRGEIMLFGAQGGLRNVLLPTFLRGDFFRYFMSDESQYKVHYIYSLFRTDLLKRADMHALEDAYCPDCYFVYSLLRFGSLRSTRETFIRYRVHSGNLGKSYSKKWKGWRKILYRIHPLGYYLGYLDFTDRRADRLRLLALIPFKHIYGQVFFWFRGARELLFRRKFY